MPRRPSRRGHLNKAQPAFSRLGRAMALATSGRKLKQQNNNSTKHRELPYDSTGMNFISSRKGKHDDTDSESEREESHSSSEDEDLSSESSGGDVQADFAFFDPKPDDFHGVKVLMTTYLDNKEWALSSFVDLILEQTTVGTVIKIEGDEDNGIYGFVSALNLQRYKDHKCMTEVKEFLLKACPDKEIKDKMQSYLGPQAADVGLLVSQYVVNLPPQLLPPLYDGLFDEILWATEDEHKNGDQKKKNKKVSSSSSEEDIIYLKAEDEIFHNLSAWSFFFPLRAQQVTTSELKEYRPMGLVMAVEATSVPNFRKQLHSFINES
ncbi:protein BCCIP homolog isoform X2 [Tanacetum coccineum]